MSKKAKKRACRTVVVSGATAIMCGGKPTEKDRSEIKRFQRYLNGEMTLAEAREYTGLSEVQAAKLAGTTSEKVVAIEQGTDPDEITTRRLMKLYQITKYQRPKSGQEPRA